MQRIGFRSTLAMILGTALLVTLQPDQVQAGDLGRATVSNPNSGDANPIENAPPKSGGPGDGAPGGGGGGTGSTNDACQGIPGTSVMRCISLPTFGNPPPAIPSTIAVLRNQLVTAGTINRYPPSPPNPPDPNRLDGIVNLPVMFYLKPPQITANGHTSVIDGNRNRSWSTPLGQYTVTLTLQSIDWDFGDGQHAKFLNLLSTVDFSEAFGQDIYPPNGTSTVNHAYQQTGRFGVTATEQWRVVVTDAAGSWLQAVTFMVVAQAAQGHRSDSVMVTFPDGTQLPAWPEYVKVWQAQMVPVG